MERIGESGHKKRSRNNDADRRKIIFFNGEKYFYEKCNHVIKNVGNRNPNVYRAQHVKRNKSLKENLVKHEKSGPVTSSRFSHIPKYTVKKEVKEGGQKGKCTELHEKNISVKVEEKNSDDDTSTEVEILDSDEIIKRRTSSAFVPSTIYGSDFGALKASSGYRERVLNILEKPFDKTEYRDLSEEVKVYVANYPDLKEKLAECEYDKLTRMNILRGFFYWLQNVVHDEAFKPWTDSQCLALKPGSGRGN